MVETVKIKDMRMLVTPHPVFVNKNESADEIARAFIANPRLKSVYVVDDKLELLGKVTLKKLIKHEFIDLLPSHFGILDFNALEFIGKKNAEDLMFSAIYINDEDTLKTAFVKMYENDLDELPVVDNKNRLIGNIDLLELLTVLIENKEQKTGKKYLSLNFKRPFHERFR